MLPKKERLTKAAFNRSFSIGKRVHTPYVQLIFAPSDTFHAASVVGKKVYKKAVDRNKLRRRIYAVLYQFAKKNKVAKTFIVVAKPGVTNATFKELQEDLQDALSKIS